MICAHLILESARGHTAADGEDEGHAALAGHGGRRSSVHCARGVRALCCCLFGAVHGLWSDRFVVDVGGDLCDSGVALNPPCNEIEGAVMSVITAIITTIIVIALDSLSVASGGGQSSQPHADCRAPDRAAPQW